MTRLVRKTVLALYAASLAAAALAVCPCPMPRKAAAEDHACCAKSGLAAATECCNAPSLQSKEPAVAESAAVAAPPAAAAWIETRAAVCTSSVPARKALPHSASPPSVLRI